jgi:predicted Zn-dependent protease
MMWRYSRAMAYAARKDAARANEAQAFFAKESAALPPDTGFAEMNRAVEVLSVANEVLAARLDAAHGRTESAIAHWQKAVEAQDKLNYDEPPDWYYPVRESLGAALLATGKAKDAETVLREDLRRNTRNPRSLFGLKESLAAQHADSDASWVERQFRETRKNADSELKLGDL